MTCRRWLRPLCREWTRSGKKMIRVPSWQTSLTGLAELVCVLYITGKLRFTITRAAQKLASTQHLQEARLSVLSVPVMFLRGTSLSTAGDSVKGETHPLLKF